MKTTKIFPSIFAFKTLDIGQEIKKFDELASGFHIDIMDGQYVSNFAFPIYMLEMLKKYTKKPIHIHAMMYIDNYVSQLIACNPEIIYFHPDSADMPENILAQIQESTTAGIAITDICEVKVYAELIRKVDNILFMTVQPGRCGQKFIESKIDDLVKLKKMFPHKNIIVDGGINAYVLKKIHVNINGAVVGSSLYDPNFINKL